jgi:hypothetical protein
VLTPAILVHRPHPVGDAAFAPGTCEEVTRTAKGSKGVVEKLRQDLWVLHVEENDVFCLGKAINRGAPSLAMKKAPPIGVPEEQRQCI